MIDTPDVDLLEQFARENSSAAFAILVERHIDLVHSVALRYTANPQKAFNRRLRQIAQLINSFYSQLAEEVLQAVFMELAKKQPNIILTACFI